MEVKLCDLGGDNIVRLQKFEYNEALDFINRDGFRYSLCSLQVSKLRDFLNEVYPTEKKEC